MSLPGLTRIQLQVLSYVRRHTDPGVCPLAGNSVGYDRLFLQKHMPMLAKHLHYRIIDVSTIKEVSRFLEEGDQWNF